MHYPPALPCLPAVCCLSVFCPCCVSYHLRKRVLRGDMSRYLCCNGDWPCSGRCGEQSAPEFCLGLEVGAAGVGGAASQQRPGSCCSPSIQNLPAGAVAWLISQLPSPPAPVPPVPL